MRLIYGLIFSFFACHYGYAEIAQKTFGLKRVTSEYLGFNGEVEKLSSIPDTTEIYDITINKSWSFPALTFLFDGNYYIELKYLPSDLLGIINESYFVKVVNTRYLKVPQSKINELNNDKLKLGITLSEEYFKSQELLNNKAENKESHPIDATFINYDINVPFDDLSAVRGFVDVNYSSKNNWRLKNAYLWDADAIVRLSTTWTKDIEGGKRVTIGDMATSTTGNFGSVNVAGIKLATSYFTRSAEFIDALPFLTIAGFAVNPTRLDLYLNDQKIQQSEIEAGKYNLKLPYKQNGYGVAEAVVYDVSGNPTRVSVPFYNSIEMLRAGAKEYEVSAGTIRKNLGIKNYDYDSYIGSGLLKIGVNDWYTQDIFGQYSDFYWTASGLAHFTPIKQLGIIHAGYSNNSYNQNLYTIGWDRQSIIGSLGFNYSTTADSKMPFCYGFGQDCVYDELRMYAGTSLPYKLGAVNFNYINRNSLTEKTRVKTAQYTKQLTNSVGLFANLTEAKGVAVDEKTAYLGVSINFDRLFTNTGFIKNRNGFNFQEGIYLPEDSNNPEYGYGSLTLNRSSARKTENLFYGARLSKLNYQLNVFNDHEMVQGNLNLSGGGVYIADENYFTLTRPLESGLAFVKIKNLKEPIRIDRENRFSGYTDDKGRFLVPNVVPMNNERITVDINKLPQGVTMDKYKADYFVPASGAVRIDFTAKPLPFTVKIKGAPSGAIFNIGEDYFVVGENGEASIDAEGEAVVPMGDGKSCTINIKSEVKEYTCLES